MTNLTADRILASRSELMTSLPIMRRTDDAAEGGCGVLGFAANIPVAGRHVLAASRQMHNRGNGKGGGIAMVGLDPAQSGVGADILSSHYLLQVALLDPTARREVEDTFILPHFDVGAAYELAHVDDFHQVEGFWGRIRRGCAWICTGMQATMLPLAWMGLRSTCMAMARTSLGKS